jgi:hypothetical protein
LSHFDACPADILTWLKSRWREEDFLKDATSARDQIPVSLGPSDPRVARALPAGEINTQPPSIPGDTCPIAYRITPQPDHTHSL